MPRSPRQLLLAAAALAAAVAGCDGSASLNAPPDDGGLVCTASVEPGILVEVTDARTGAHVARDAAGAVREGSFVDSLRPAVSRGIPPADTLVSLQAAPERAGTYEVTVTRAGYRPWSQQGVRVTRGSCHVNTVTVAARLTPLS